jgi:hypothetical protein
MSLKTNLRPLHLIIIFICFGLCSLSSLSAQTSITLGSDSIADSTGIIGNCAYLPLTITYYIAGNGANIPSGSDSVYVQINWGDGQSSSDSTDIGGNFNYFSHDFSHTYTSPGSYSIQTIAISSNGATDTMISSVPLVVSLGCTTVSGKIYSDNNSNCIFDAGDDTIRYASILATTTSGANVGYGYSDVNGNYSMNVASGLPNLELNVIPPFQMISFTQIDCPISGSYTFNSTSNQNFDFSMTCDTAVVVKSVYTWGNLKPPGDTNGYMFGVFHLYGCSGGFNNIDTLTAIIPNEAHLLPSSFLGFNNLLPAPNVISGDTLIWYATISQTPFSGLNFRRYAFNVNLGTDTSATIFDTAYFKTHIDSLNSSSLYGSNSSTMQYVIGGPYDPNNKISFPQGVGPNGWIDTNTQFLTYLVNFQNTGTAPAVNVFIIDSLSDFLDWNSVEILSESDPMKVIHYDENKLKFLFSDINLPDSNSNEPASHGNLMYRVKLKENLPLGTVIENTAHIFFDYNAPIVTNTTINTIHEFPAEPPVPLAFELSGQDVTCLNNDNGKIDLTIISGNAPYSITWSNGENAMSISDLSAGFYSVTITDSASQTDIQSFEIFENRIYGDPVLGVVNGNLQAQSWANFIYTIESSAGSEYEWNALGGEVLSTANASAEIRWFAGPEGEIIVTEKDMNGCMAWDSIPVGITFLGTSELHIEGIRVYPNPTSERLNVEVDNISDNGSLKLFDGMGRLVISQTLESKLSTLDVSNLNKGTYTLQVSSEEGEKSIQILVN